MKLKRAVLAIGLICVTLVLLVFTVGLSEKLSCHVDNFLNWQFGNQQFDPVVKVQGEVLEVDFRHLDQVSAVCIVHMYSYGRPYDTRALRRYETATNKKKACWAYQQDEMTVLYITKQGSAEWGRLKLKIPRNRYLRIVSNDCSAIPQALLRCEGDKCSF